jgi:hypothetical protein
MSSKYQSDELVIPEGFPALLKGFAREVLRAQVRRAAAPQRPGWGSPAPLQLCVACSVATSQKPMRMAPPLPGSRAMPASHAGGPNMQTSASALRSAPNLDDPTAWPPYSIQTQPSDVYEFGARYFADLAAARGGGSGGGGGCGGGGGGGAGSAPAGTADKRQDS